MAKPFRTGRHARIHRPEGHADEAIIPVTGGCGGPRSARRSPHRPPWRREGPKSPALALGRSAWARAGVTVKLKAKIPTMAMTKERVAGSTGSTRRSGNPRAAAPWPRTTAGVLPLGGAA